MANTNILPYGQGGELPDGYHITDSLDENVSNKAASAKAAYKLKRMIGCATQIVVAANNTPTDLKSSAQYVCDGTNDEVEINAAIALAISEGKNVLLLRGDYYLDARPKQYNTANDTFLLVDTSGSKGITITGEDPFNRPIIRVSNTAYEAIGSTEECVVLAISDTSQYGGFVELRNFKIQLPSNQKKICAVDMLNYGGWARMHSVSITGYTNGYDGNNVSLQGAPKKAAEGCIGLRFIGKGPNGAYGSEITDCGITGFYEGISLNTEWTVCNHVYSIHCVYGWVFGKYTSTSVHSSTHPHVLILCGSERDVNLPYFYNTSGKQDIEMIAFSIERVAGNVTPGGVLGDMAKERVQGSFRGNITYCTGQGTGNSVDIGFWHYGHGHGCKTTDTSHQQAGSTAQRNLYRPNYMQHFWDTTLGKEVICVDENPSSPVWKDAAGNTVSNS